MLQTGRPGSDGDRALSGDRSAVRGAGIVAENGGRRNLLEAEDAAIMHVITGSHFGGDHSVAAGPSRADVGIQGRVAAQTVTEPERGR
jgi:hypothetical protein